MPTPLFTFRLAPETTRTLYEVSRIYGAPSASAFCRELVTVTVSGDVTQLGAFIQRLISKMGEQLTLPLAAPVLPRKRVSKGKRRRKRGRTP